MPESRAHSHYTGEAGRRYHEGKRGIPAGTYDWIARLRAEKLQPRIRAGDTVFEPGAGTGWNLAALKCARRIGSDVSDLGSEEMRRRGIEFVADARGIPTASIDVVICHHVLEHLPSPFEALGELRRILKPAGKLLLFVPFERERRYRRFVPDEPNHHLFAWNVQTLGNLVTDTGFMVEEAAPRQFRFDRFAAQMAYRLRIGEGGYRVIRAVGLLVAPEYEIALVARPEEPR